jgi:hypothetical protein
MVDTGPPGRRSLPHTGQLSTSAASLPAAVSAHRFPALWAFDPRGLANPGKVMPGLAS